MTRPRGCRRGRFRGGTLAPAPNPAGELGHLADVPKARRAERQSRPPSAVALSRKGRGRDVPAHTQAPASTHASTRKRLVADAALCHTGTCSFASMHALRTAAVAVLASLVVGGTACGESTVGESNLQARSLPSAGAVASEFTTTPPPGQRLAKPRCTRLGIELTSSPTGGRPTSEIDRAASVTNSKRGDGTETTLRFDDGTYTVSRCDRSGHLLAAQHVVALRVGGQTVFRADRLEKRSKGTRYGRFGTTVVHSHHPGPYEKDRARARRARELVRPGGATFPPTRQ